MWNMSCIWCQDVRVPLPQPPPPCFINYSRVEFGQVGAKEPDGERRRDRGSFAARHSAALMPGSVGLTRGCMPYQDPVYSQPKKLPGTHFHNAACGPLRKLIPLCRRCTMMLPALYLSHFAFCVLCFSLLFPSLFLPSHLSITPYLLCLLFSPLSPSTLFFFSSSSNHWIISFSVNSQWLQYSGNVVVTHDHVVGLARWIRLLV